MGIHLMAALGTSDYSKISYKFPKRSTPQQPQRFIQTAIADYVNSISGANLEKVSLFLTEKARLNNWESVDVVSEPANVSPETEEAIRAIFDAQGKIVLSDGTQIRKPRPVVTGRKLGLREELQGVIGSGVKVDEIAIPDGRNEDEIWQIFNEIYYAIEDGDEIIFDITHGFRSLPLVMMAVIYYARVLKNCTIRAIYYGAFEASERQGGEVIAPVFDLLQFIDIVDWADAANAFITYGSAKAIRKSYDKLAARTPNPTDLASIESLVKSMDVLSKCLLLSRGTYGSYLRNDRNGMQKSIEVAFANLRERHSRLSLSDLQQLNLAPLYPLMREVVDSFYRFDDRSDWRVWGCGSGLVSRARSHSAGVYGYGVPGGSIFM